MDGLSSYRYGDEVRHKEHDIEADWCFRSARRSLLHSLSLSAPLFMYVTSARVRVCVCMYVMVMIKYCKLPCALLFCHLVCRSSGVGRTLPLSPR